MKKAITILSLVICAGGNAQPTPTTVTIQENNVAAIISDAGVFFRDFNTNTPGYEVPKGASAHVISGSAFWFGGKDINGQMKMAAPNIFANGRDLWPGALVVGTGACVNPNPLGQTLWPVSKSEIEQHLLNYQQPGYVTPQSILTWPAHGDVAQGQSYYLAPFYDNPLGVNGADGVYNPADGDTPCIKGDYAVYTIMNDMFSIHGSSGGDPIGLEVHYMFYQYSTVNILDNTTFVEVTAFNRGTQTIFDFVTAYAIDGDIGGGADDFVGCDTTRNLAYFYNADAFDEDAVGSIGYGANAPSFGVVCLNDKLDKFGYYTGSGAVYPYSDPSNAQECYNFMTGSWANSSAWYYGGSGYPGSAGVTTTLTSFLFPDNPNDANGWSEQTAGTNKGDRRTVASTNYGTFAPGDVINLVYAIVYERSGTSHLDNVNALMNTVDEVQLFYDNMNYNCDNSILGVNKVIDNNQISIFPNPSNGTFYIDLNGVESSYIVVNDMTGKEVYREDLEGKSNVSIDLICETGMYIVKIASNDEVWSKKITIN